MGTLDILTRIGARDATPQERAALNQIVTIFINTEFIMLKAKPSVYYEFVCRSDLAPVMRPGIVQIIMDRQAAAGETRRTVVDALLYTSTEDDSETF